MTYVDAANGKDLWDVEDGWIPPVVGQGVIDEGGQRFRVVDVWVNREKHGRGLGEYGIYAFVSPAVGDDDRPGLLHPSHYERD